MTHFQNVLAVSAAHEAVGVDSRTHARTHGSFQYSHLLSAVQCHQTHTYCSVLQCLDDGNINNGPHTPSFHNQNCPQSIPVYVAQLPSLSSGACFFYLNKHHLTVCIHQYPGMVLSQPMFFFCFPIKHLTII